MTKLEETASELLAHARVAVTGVSRHPMDHGSNVVYKRLRDRGMRFSPSIPTPMKSREMRALAT